MKCCRSFPKEFVEDEEGKRDKLRVRFIDTSKDEAVQRKRELRDSYRGYSGKEGDRGFRHANEFRDLPSR